MSFEVVPADVDAAGQQVAALSGAVPLVVAYVESHVRIAGGSKIFAQFQGEIDQMRTRLVDDYSSKAEVLFTSAGGALQQMATEYRTVDLAQASGFDAQLPDGYEYDGPSGMYPGEATAGVDLADFTTLLSPPATEFAEWEEFGEMRDGLDSILSWDWLFDLLGLVGVPSISDMATEWLQGDYDSMGTCMQAIQEVASFWTLVRQEMAASMLAVDETWSGNAANAAFAWFSEYDDVLAEHASSVSGVYSRMYGYAIGLRMVIDSILGLVETIGELVIGLSGWPTSWTDVLDWLMRGAWKLVLRKIFIIIDAILALFDAAMLVAGLLSMLFSQLAGHADIGFPDDVAALEPSDVDGP